MMRPEEGALVDAFAEAFQAIDILFERKLFQSALVLLYATMDAAAWLDVHGTGDVTRGDFVRWVERYLLPDSDLTCTALELYGARCGVLHSLSAVSKLSRQGRVRTVGYAHGSASVEHLDQVARVLGRSDVVGVHVESLRAALKRGMQRFLGDAAADGQRWSNIRARSKYLFSNLPQVAVTSTRKENDTSDA